MTVSWCISDKAVQCSVCFEDFKLDESVKRLPCDHHYHSECIVPWLELVSVEQEQRLETFYRPNYLAWLETSLRQRDFPFDCRCFQNSKLAGPFPLSLRFASLTNCDFVSSMARVLYAGRHLTAKIRAQTT